MLALPEQFDWNEWILLITFIVVLVIFLLLPKRIPRIVTILIFVMTMYVAKLADYALSIEVIDFYDINDSTKFELFDFVTWVIYGFFGYFLVYLYDKLRPRAGYLWLYIFGWSVCSAVFEWLTSLVGIFNYKGGWNPFYSFIFYLFALSIVLIYFHFIKSHLLKIKKL